MKRLMHAVAAGTYLFNSLLSFFLSTYPLGRPRILTFLGVSDKTGITKLQHFFLINIETGSARIFQFS